MSQLLSLIKEKGALIGTFLVSLSAVGVIGYFLSNRKKDIKKVGILDLVGNTPLVYLPKLSKSANCEIYVPFTLVDQNGVSESLWKQ